MVANTGIWVWVALGLAAALLILLILRVRYRARDGGVRRALKAIAVDSLENVLVPDGMGGVIHIEHLLLTSRGLLVVNVKPYEGIVFASDRMDDWTVIRDGTRSSISNPIGSLYDRVAAVKQIVRDVNVQGFVLFPEGADFSKGQPQAVILPDALSAAFPLPGDSDRERVTVAFQPYWERVRSVVEATGPA
jgi:hypothetical protein